MNRLTRALGWAVFAGITAVHDGGDLPERIPQDLTIVDHHEHAGICTAFVTFTGSTCSPNRLAPDHVVGSTGILDGLGAGFIPTSSPNAVSSDTRTSSEVATPAQLCDTAAPTT